MCHHQPPPRAAGMVPPMAGLIAGSVRLTCAVHYFAGGDPYNIAGVFGIGHACVCDSTWMVVDAANKCPALQILFPEDHQDQLQLAEGFRKKSREANFPNNCVCAIDGTLIWIEKSHFRSTEEAESAQLSFHCGLKNKCGLNMQAVCDADRRFLYMDISMPGRTAGYLAFSTCDLQYVVGASRLNSNNRSPPVPFDISGITCSWSRLCLGIPLDSSPRDNSKF